MTEPQEPAQGAGLRQPWPAMRAMPASTRVGFGTYAELPGTPQAVRQAREVVSHGLGENYPYAHDTTLITSELSSNAILHSRSSQPGGTITIAVETTPPHGDVRIQVRDAGGQQAPALTTTGLAGEHDRGLAIISALATDWDTETTHAGRATWCRLSASRRPAAAAAPRAGTGGRLMTADGVRSIPCPCQPRLGEPCTPLGDHLARYLSAETAGAVSRDT